MFYVLMWFYTGTFFLSWVYSEFILFLHNLKLLPFYSVANSDQISCLMVWNSRITLYNSTLFYSNENTVSSQETFPIGSSVTYWCFYSHRFGAAEQDCTFALELDPKYTKALLRRATARLKLKKWKSALEDFNSVLKQEPNNKQAITEIKNIEKVRKNFSICMNLPTVKASAPQTISSRFIYTWDSCSVDRVKAFERLSESPELNSCEIWMFTTQKSKPFHCSVLG